VKELNSIRTSWVSGRAARIHGRNDADRTRIKTPWAVQQQVSKIYIVCHMSVNDDRISPPCPHPKGTESQNFRDPLPTPIQYNTQHQILHDNQLLTKNC